MARPCANWLVPAAASCGEHSKGSRQGRGVGADAARTSGENNETAEADHREGGTKSKRVALGKAQAFARCDGAESSRFREPGRTTQRGEHARMSQPEHVDMLRNLADYSITKDLQEQPNGCVVSGPEPQRPVSA